MKLKPDEFWGLTYVEICDLLEAFVAEEERQDDIVNQRLSWQTALIMNSSGNLRKQVKPTDLYRPKYMEGQQEDTSQKVVKKFTSKEEKTKYLEELKSKFDK